MMKVVWTDPRGQLIRTFSWREGDDFVLVKSPETGRVSALSSQPDKASGLVVLAKPSLSKKSVQLTDDLGSISVVTTDKDLIVQKDLSLNESDDEDSAKSLPLIMKWTTGGHLASLGFVFALHWIFKPGDEVETVTVIAQQDLEIKKEIKPKLKRKQVHVSEKKLKPVQKNAKVRAKQKSKTQAVASNQKRRAKVKSHNANSKVDMGVLSAFGGTKSGSKSAGAGLNLNSNQNYAGSGSSPGLKAAGTSLAGLSGQGLVAHSGGVGSRVGKTFGYGSGGTAGGRSGFGSQTIGGSMGGSRYHHPLSEDGDVDGGLERGQIAAVINRNLGQVIYCYEKGLQSSPGLSGRVVVDFVIGGNGRVAAAATGATNLNSSSVENCIVNKLKSWKFPKPMGNVDVKVSYPFLLKRVGQG